MARSKKEALENLSKGNDYSQVKQEEKKKDRCQFVDQITATRFKLFTNKDMVKYCINHDEPIITEMFERLDENHQQAEWV